MTYNTGKLRSRELAKQVESYRLFRADFELTLKTALATEKLFDEVMLSMKVKIALLVH